MIIYMYDIYRVSALCVSHFVEKCERVCICSVNRENQCPSMSFSTKYSVDADKKKSD